MTDQAGVSLDTALAVARRPLASVTERATQHGYYSGARTDIINAHADMRAALDLLIMAAAGDEGSAAKTPERDSAAATGGDGS